MMGEKKQALQCSNCGFGFPEPDAYRHGDTVRCPVCQYQWIPAYSLQSGVEKLEHSIGVEPGFTLNMPQQRSRMHWMQYDHNGLKVAALTFNSTGEVPNAWWRFWARVLLDVRWERVDDD